MRWMNEFALSAATEKKQKQKEDKLDVYESARSIMTSELRAPKLVRTEWKETA